VFTGWKLIGLDKIISSFKTSKEDFVFLVGTIVAILSTNLMVGMVVALLSYVLWLKIGKRLLYNNSIIKS
jgi:MFS superfamily sulfate permease-like transporter